MSRPLLPALLALSLLFGCHRAQPGSLPQAAIVPERIPSSEISMNATWGSDARVGITLVITLTNVGQRTLMFDTGLPGYPMADFAFSLERPNHECLAVFCRFCVPRSASRTDAYTVRLRHSQFLRFTLPLSTFFATDPQSGNTINLRDGEGKILVELAVPTPPGAKHKWPGYVSAKLPLSRTPSN